MCYIEFVNFVYMGNLRIDSMMCDMVVWVSFPLTFICVVYVLFVWCVYEWVSVGMNSMMFSVCVSGQDLHWCLISLVLMLMLCVGVSFPMMVIVCGVCV